MAEDIIQFQAGRQAAIAGEKRDGRRAADWLEGFDQVAADPWNKRCERVLGAELRAGDVVRNHGYRWSIQRVEYDDCARAPLPGPNGGLGRWYVYAAALGAEAADLPGLYRDRMEMALREDLHWSREVAA